MTDPPPTPNQPPQEPWYYAVANQQHGPVPADTLRRMFEAGQLHPATWVWREGLANWTTAASVPELVAGLHFPAGGLRRAAPKGDGRPTSSTGRPRDSRTPRPTPWRCS